ncbi:hypothetical protein [Burkholderia ambifaria]|uniref:hypothetical protein n=1 Tax=Burkholderia ambifaria TaxID=152480 RepID=UPI001C936DEC|nr:hypothetical protein [Burkholderia ambifaria]MBY4766735.1 hypothetical protein [Burkholderia ambifaria]
MPNTRLFNAGISRTPTFSIPALKYKPALQHFDDEQKRERFRPIVPVNLRDIGARKVG